MLIAGEISRSFPETIFGRSLPQGSPFMPNIEQKIALLFRRENCGKGCDSKN
jgi:hypothetical protein